MRESEARCMSEPALEAGEEVVWCGTSVTGGISTRRLGTLLRAFDITDRRLLAVVGPTAEIPWSLTPESVAYVPVQRLGGEMANVRFNRSRCRRGRGYGHLDRLYTFECLVSRPSAKPPSSRARRLRRIEQPDFGVRIEVPASWKEEPPAQNDGACHFLSSDLGLDPETKSGERLLVLQGPLGASFTLDAALAGTWTLERARDTLRSLGWMPTVVEETAEMTIGSVSGFSITYEMGLSQILGSHAAVGRGGGVRTEFVVLEHGDSQLRFALGWITRFPPPSRAAESDRSVLRAYGGPREGSAVKSMLEVHPTQ